MQSSISKYHITKRMAVIILSLLSMVYYITTLSVIEEFTLQGTETERIMSTPTVSSNQPDGYNVQEWKPVQLRQNNKTIFTTMSSNCSNGSRLPLLQSGHKYNPKWLVISHARKVAVTIIPKVMCTSIRHTMSKIEKCSTAYGMNLTPLRLDLQKDETKVVNIIREQTSHYYNGICIGRCNKARCNDLLRYNKTMYIESLDYTTILFLRDPFERALSAYKNSETNRHILLDNCTKASECTFEEWVGQLVFFEDSPIITVWNNEHFFPQTRIAQFMQIRYKYILRMTSKIDLNFFFHHLLGLESKMKIKVYNKSFSTFTNANATTETAIHKNHEKYKLYKSIPKRTMQKLVNFYKEDIQLWQENLERGTPRSLSREGDNETTLYDFYVEGEQKNISRS